MNLYPYFNWYDYEFRPINTPQDYDRTIYHRLHQDFFQIPYKVISELSIRDLYNYANNIGIDTLVNLILLEEKGDELRKVKNIWVTKYRCIMASMKRFVFLLFETGEYMILRKDDFKEIEHVRYNDSKLLKFGTFTEDLVLIKYCDNFDKEFENVHVSSYKFNHKMFFEIILNQYLASYVDNSCDFEFMKKIMLKRIRYMLDYCHDVPILHSKIDVNIFKFICKDTYEKHKEDLKYDYLLEYVFSKKPEVFKWKTVDNRSKYPNMFAIECPIVGDKERALKSIKKHGKDISKYCRRLLAISDATADIYKFLVFDRSVYTADGRLMMYYCYKGDDKMAEE